MIYTLFFRRLATRQHNHESLDLPSGSGQDYSHTSPPTSHFTQCQSAALRLGQGCSTETPPAESSFIVTRSGGSKSTPLNNRVNDKDRGNDGDDEGSGDLRDRLLSAERALQEVAPEINVEPVQHEEQYPIGEGEPVESDHEENVPDNAKSVLRHSGESLGDDCENLCDVENNYDEEADTEGDECNNSVGSSLRTIRSGGNCRVKDKGLDASPVLRPVSIFMIFAKPLYEIVSFSVILSMILTIALSLFVTGRLFLKSVNQLISDLPV